jgi:hypothetical protein
MSIAYEHSTDIDHPQVLPGPAGAGGAGLNPTETMADTNDNTAATGFDWTSLLTKGLDVAGDIITLKYGQTSTPAVQPTTLNPANPGTTGQASASAPASQTASGLNNTTLIAIGGGVLVLLAGMFMLGGRRR